MARIPDRDGPAAVAYLEQLIVRLRAEPAPSALDLGALAEDVFNAAEDARTWAEAHGVPRACVPAVPAGALTVERAVTFLTELTASLRWLERRARLPHTMRQVVGWLRASGSGALGELDLALRAVDETLRNLVTVRDVSAQLGRFLREREHQEAARRADRVLGALEQIVIATAEIRSGLADWADPGHGAGSG